MELERSKIVQGPAERVFAIASDVQHMTKWLPTTERVETDGPNHIHLEGERANAHYEGQGLLRARPEQLRLEWGSDRTGDYAGWLQVEHQGATDTSEVVLHLSFFDELDKTYRAGHGDAVAAELEEALERLAQLVADSA